MIKAVLFDFDGVIVDSEESHRETFMALLPLKIGRERWYREFAGTGSRRIFERLLEEAGETGNVDALVERRRALFDSMIDRGRVKGIPGIVEFLAFLRSKGVKTAIVSGGHRSYIDKLLDILKIGEYFDFIVSADEIKERKPDPGPFLHAARVLETAPEDCLVFEDSASGCAAARAAGMKLVLMDSPASRFSEKPDLAIKDFREMEGLKKRFF